MLEAAQPPVELLEQLVKLCGPESVAVAVIVWRLQVLRKWLGEKVTNHERRLERLERAAGVPHSIEGDISAVQVP